MVYIIKSESYRLLDNKIKELTNDIDKENITHFDLTIDTLKDIIEDIAENTKAIQDEAKTRAEEDKKLQDAIDVINGDAETEGSFKKAIAEQAATQLQKDNAQDQRMDGIDTAIGVQGEGDAIGTGLHGRIDQEIATRTSEDARLEGRISDIEGLIGGEEGSASLKELNDRLNYLRN